MIRLAKLVGCVALLGTVTAVAGPDTPAPVAAPAPAPEPAVQATPVMSPGDMNVSVASLQARIDDDATQVQRLQEVAKKQKDVIKLNCVNDRLVQVKAQRNIADDTHSQLLISIQKNSDERKSLYDRFVATADTIKELHEQAKACIGAPELYKQESGVTVDRPLVVDDPTVLVPSDIPVEPPGYASPYD